MKDQIVIGSVNLRTMTEAKLKDKTQKVYSVINKIKRNHWEITKDNAFINIRIYIDVYILEMKKIQNRYYRYNTGGDRW